MKVVDGERENMPVSVPDTIYSVKIFKPTLFKTGLNNDEKLKRNLWFLISMGKFKILYIMDGKNIAHYSFVIPKNFRFPFMKRGDLQIGPCFTDKKYRGQGLYKQALKIIPSVFASQTGKFWIYTTEINVISQHVIVNSGFNFQGLMKSYGPLRVMKTINENR
jgi:RimJ/RimL family protein N-acetyltransferase